MSAPKQTAFKQCGKFEQALFAITGAMSKRELRRTLAECDEVTTDNCSFVVFELRALLRVIVDIELLRRDRRRKQQLLPLEGVAR